MSPRLPPLLMSMLIWALVAGSAVAWGLRLWVRPTVMPAGAGLAAAPTAAGGDLARLLGAPPVEPLQEQPVAAADSRFRLLGVVAPRNGSTLGLALISVDGKPARAVVVGREVEAGGLRLLAVGHRQAELGQARGATQLTLALPPLAEPNRGRPGEAGAMPGAGMAPPGMVQPGMVAPGIPQVFRPAAVMVPGATGAAGARPAPMVPPAGVVLPGTPMQPAEQPSEGQPSDGGQPASYR